MIRNYICTFFLLFFLISCGSKNPSLTESPFGYWDSGDGYTITVSKDGSYVFCDKTVCDNGKWSILEDKSLNLDDLHNLQNSKRFMSNSGLYIETLSPWPDESLNPKIEYQFNPKKNKTGFLQPIKRFFFCDPNPCVILGYNDSRQYFFRKKTEF